MALVIAVSVFAALSTYIAYSVGYRRGVSAMVEYNEAYRRFLDWETMEEPVHPVGER